MSQDKKQTTKPVTPINYSDYLRVPQLLEQQKLRSDEYGRDAHDEMLFIITHQTSELWFKQILTELDSVLSIFSKERLREIDMAKAVSRLQRITEIQNVLIQQVTVLQTMTALDFLDFRDLLNPASGFQSVQNRMIENKLGLKSETRLTYNAQPYHSVVDASDRKQMIESEAEPSLFERVDAWLSRTPFLKTGAFDFWSHYREAVESMFAADREIVRHHDGLNAEAKEKNIKEIDATEKTFEALFDEAKYKELQEQGHFRLSFKALHATLLIQLYRDQPVFNLPFQLLTALQDIDELMTTWRSRHGLMVHRMLGKKIGTGGSSGTAYLKAATDKHRVFADFFNLATYLIPRSKLPELPQEVQSKLGFSSI